MDKAPTAKDEALRVLEQVRTVLLGNRPIDAYQRKMLSAQVDYAHDQVLQIAELKRRKRRTTMTV